MCTLFYGVFRKVGIQSVCSSEVAVALLVQKDITRQGKRII